MESEAAIIERVKALVKPLRAEARLNLIRAIAKIEPEDVEQLLPDDELDTVARRHLLLYEERTWYGQNPSERAAYRGQFVAIYHGEVVDHDLDQRALYLWVREQFGRKLVLIANGDWDEIPTYTIHSPKVER